jgi:hypothetical protein
MGAGVADGVAVAWLAAAGVTVSVGVAPSTAVAVDVSARAGMWVAVGGAVAVSTGPAVDAVISAGAVAAAGAVTDGDGVKVCPAGGEGRGMSSNVGAAGDSGGGGRVGEAGNAETDVTADVAARATGDAVTTGPVVGVRAATLTRIIPIRMDTASSGAINARPTPAMSVNRAGRRGRAERSGEGDIWLCQYSNSPVSQPEGCGIRAKCVAVEFSVPAQELARLRTRYSSRC